MSGARVLAECRGRELETGVGQTEITEVDWSNSRNFERIFGPVSHVHPQNPTSNRWFQRAQDRLVVLSVVEVGVDTSLLGVGDVR
jgi:hypothetical protein